MYNALSAGGCRARARRSGDGGVDGAAACDARGGNIYMYVCIYVYIKRQIYIYIYLWIYMYI